MPFALQTMSAPLHVRDLQQACPGLPQGPWHTSLLHVVPSLHGAASPVQHALPDVPHPPSPTGPSPIDESPGCESPGG